MKIGKKLLGICTFLFALGIIFMPDNKVQAAFEAPYYDMSTPGIKWDGYKAYINGELVTSSFFCDGMYTYYLQANGTKMVNQLTYHPDGVHIIYFDANGRETFSNFQNVKKSISGQAVDDYCFFDVNGYMYVDVLTYNQDGSKMYYVNPYGVIERYGFFTYSNTVKWADGTSADAYHGQYGYGQSDASLLTNASQTDESGNIYFCQGNGIAVLQQAYVDTRVANNYDMAAIGLNYLLQHLKTADGTKIGTVYIYTDVKYGDIMQTIFIHAYSKNSYGRYIDVYAAVDRYSEAPEGKDSVVGNDGYYYVFHISNYCLYGVGDGEPDPSKYAGEYLNNDMVIQRYHDLYDPNSTITLGNVGSCGTYAY